MPPLPNVWGINSLQPLPLLHEATLEYLRHTKNLLAFSGGGDSTALFFLLHENKIPFDIVHVNYQTRAQSNEEEAYARTLANTHTKELFTLTCKLDASNFEHHAREERYSFFVKVIQEHNYETLLTAHHLGDQLEWFLMQLCKGAGLVEMLGMQEIEERENYTIVRPLLHISKKRLQTYLNEYNILYFNDESNDSLHYKRNQFRHHYAHPMIDDYETAIAKSFEYLQEDKKRLLPSIMERINDLFIIPKQSDELLNIRQIDKALKLLGILPSKAQRDEILRTHSCVIGGKIAVCYADEKIFIAPYCKIEMDKKFKEVCRKERIPSKIRPYLFQEGIDPSALSR